MRYPTDAELEALEALALQRSALSGDLAELEVPEADIVLELRPLSRAEFIDYFNGTWAQETRENARTVALYQAAIFPSRAEITAARETFPGLTKRAVEVIEKLGGRSAIEWIPFDATVSDEALAEYGIPVEVATDLRGRFHHRGQLWIARVGDEEKRTLVLKRATGATHRAVTEAIDDANADRYAAGLSAAVDCTLWPAEDELRALFRAQPALPCSVLFVKILRLMRGEAEVAQKKLVRRGRRSGVST